MPIPLAFIAPHGDELLPEIYPKFDERMLGLNSALKSMAGEIRKLGPDSIVIATPHNLRLRGFIGVIGSEYIEGSWGGGDAKLFLRVRVDRDLAKGIYGFSHDSDLPVVYVNYGTAGGPLSTMCMDWGTFIPLWFVHREYLAHDEKLPPIVVVTPSREIPWSVLVNFGFKISEAVENLNKKVVFIASADQAHAHDPSGPYGFDEAASEYDEKVIAIVKSGNLEGLLDFDASLIERTKPDSFWQMLILAGIVKREGLRFRDYVYGRPTYFGMLYAAFTK